MDALEEAAEAEDVWLVKLMVADFVVLVVKCLRTIRNTEADDASVAKEHTVPKRTR